MLFDINYCGFYNFNIPVYYIGNISISRVTIRKKTFYFLMMLYIIRSHTNNFKVKFKFLMVAQFVGIKWNRYI